MLGSGLLIPLSGELYFVVKNFVHQPKDVWALAVVLQELVDSLLDGNISLIQQLVQELKD